MSAIEIVLGDFESGVVRLHGDDSGRLFVVLTGLDGASETVSLHIEIAGCALHDEGSVAPYLDRWLRAAGTTLDTVLAESFPHERVCVVVLKGGRKFVARAHPDVVAKLKACTARPEATRRMLARGNGVPIVPKRKGPTLLSRILSGKA